MTSTTNDKPLDHRTQDHVITLIHDMLTTLNCHVHLQKEMLVPITLSLS